MQQDDLNTVEHYACNIDNLTGLWEAMGATAVGPDIGPVLRVSQRWPDRLWFNVQPPHEYADVQRLIDVARAASRRLLVPVWCRDESEQPRQAGRTDVPSLGRELGAAGFTVAFEQTLMASSLAGLRPNASTGVDVELQRVEGDTSGWADVASRSFGYTVPAAVTDHLVGNAGASLIIARQGGQAVGTGLLYAHEQTAGLHMLGVVPEARRKGFAREIMVRLLDEATARGFGLATLQASRMGEGLYRQLGFESQGRLLNFQRPPAAEVTGLENASEANRGPR